MKEFLTFVAEIFDVALGTISLETAYETIPEWDSVMHLRLVMEISEKYGVDIPLEDVPNIKTLRQFYEYVKRA